MCFLYKTAYECDLGTCDLDLCIRIPRELEQYNYYFIALAITIYAHVLVIFILLTVVSRTIVCESEN